MPCRRATKAAAKVEMHMREYKLEGSQCKRGFVVDEHGKDSRYLGVDHAQVPEPLQDSLGERPRFGRWQLVKGPRQEPGGHSMVATGKRLGLHTALLQGICRSL